MRYLLNASEEKADFFELIGTWVTFGSDIITIGGAVLHSKGDRIYISDVIYTPGYWSRLCPYIWVKPEISAFKVAGIARHYSPTTFVEYKKPK
jgi:hypothetical protein